MIAGENDRSGKVATAAMDGRNTENYANSDRSLMFKYESTPGEFRK